MTELHDLILNEIGVGDDSFFLSPEAMRDALKAVVELHRPLRIYDDCGHYHTDTYPGVSEVYDVGLVCEDGYMYTICRHCCASDGYQLEECAGAHDKAGFCHPCPTVRVIADKLRLLAEVTSND